MKLPPLPPLYLLAGLGLIAGLQRLLPGLTLLPGFVQAAGAGVMALGALAALAGIATLLRHKTTFTFDKSAALVSSGIFRLSRNPVYLGLELALLGGALASGNLAALAVPAAVFVALDRHFLPLEEAKLERELGEAYRRYKAATPRWL